MFEHASDCKILIKHLHQLQVVEGETAKEAAGPKGGSTSNLSTNPGKIFFAKLQKQNEPQEKSLSRVSSMSTIGESEEEDSGKGNDDSILVTIQKELLDLTLKANGKADLYFHAYFWTTFGLHLYMRTNHSNNIQT